MSNGIKYCDLTPYNVQIVYNQQLLKIGKFVFLPHPLLPTDVNAPMLGDTEFILEIIEPETESGKRIHNVEDLKNLLF